MALFKPANSHGYYQARLLPAAAETSLANKYFGLFLLFVFVMPLWPNYAELKFGGLPNLAPDRLIRTALVFGFIWIFFSNSAAVHTLKQRLEKNWILISVLLAFYGIRIVSAFVAHDPLFQLFAFFRNELLVSLPIFFIALLAIEDEKSVKKVFVALTAAGVIASILALVDFYREKNIFMGLIPITSDYLMAVFLDKTRDFTYRAQGTFEHPIMLGQYFALTLPITWTLFKESKGFVRPCFYAIAGVLALGSVYISGSRIALGVAVLTMMLFAFWEIILWIRTSRNRVLQYLVLSQLPLPIVAAVSGLYMFKSTATGSTQETLSSTNARLDMLVGGFPKIFDSPIIGHGLGEHLSVFSLLGRAGIRTLDNFYLLVGLESGVFVPILLMLFFLLSSPPVFRYFFREEGVAARRVIACALLLFGYAMQMAIHSLHGQMWLALVISVAVIVLREGENSKFSPDGTRLAFER